VQPPAFVKTMLFHEAFKLSRHLVAISLKLFWPLKPALGDFL